MTNKTSEISTSLITKNESNNDKTSMQSLDELLGTHHFKTQTIFEIEGKEFVYVAHYMWGRIKLYLDGESIFEGWDLAGIFRMSNDIHVEHQGVEYRVISRVTNWVTSSRKVTIIIDDHKAQSKTVSVLEGLKGVELIHAIAVPWLAGLAIGFFIGKHLFS